MSDHIFATRLKTLMDEAGIRNAEKLAWRLGYSRSAVYAWVSGRSLPSAENLRSLAREFSVSVDWMLGLSDHREVAA